MGKKVAPPPPKVDYGAGIAAQFGLKVKKPGDPSKSSATSSRSAPAIDDTRLKKKKKRLNSEDEETSRDAELKRKLAKQKEKEKARKKAGKMAVDVNLGFLGNEIGRRNNDGKTQKKKQTSKRG